MQPKPKNRVDPITRDGAEGGGRGIRTAPRLVPTHVSGFFFAIQDGAWQPVCRLVFFAQGSGLGRSGSGFKKDSQDCFGSRDLGEVARS